MVTMAQQQGTHRIPLEIVIGFSGLILVVGVGVAWWLLASKFLPNPSNPIVQPVEQTAQVYWLRDTGSQLELVATPMTVSGESKVTALTLALEKLLTGPETEARVLNTIPKATQLQEVTLDPDGIHVDLSQAFTSGGGSAAMTGRLAQIVYTVTSLDPHATVWLSVEGEPLEILGGEGLIIVQPMTRQDFQDHFSL